jgi:hypothetical protein
MKFTIKTIVRRKIRDKKAYRIVYGEVRKVNKSEPSYNWEMILHDHGGHTCNQCMYKVCRELNRLAKYEK